MWRRRSGLLGLALSLVLLVSLPAAVVSAEPTPHAFYGTLTIGGSPAPIGTEVTAVVEGGSGNITTTEVGKYGDAGTGPKLVVKGDIEPGALIEFYADGGKADQTANFFEGRFTELDLTVPTVMYELDVDSSVGGNVTDPVEGISHHTEGTVVDLLAEPDTCYKFVNWTGNVGTVGDVNAASTNITMSGDYSIMANFAKIEYELITASGGGGSITDPGEGTNTYDCGEVVDLLAEAETCYKFVEWTGDIGAIDDASSADTFITMSDNYSIIASFAKIGYELTTASSGGGSVTDPGEGKNTYDCGEVVDLLAEADTCYKFVNWTGDVGTVDDASSADTSITMSDNYSITANFAKIEYKLTTASSGGGSVTDPGEGENTYDCGEVVDLLAEPATGYAFVNWTGDVGTVDDVNSADTFITMSDNYSITANFVDITITYNLTVASTAGGNVTDPGEGTFTGYHNGAIVDLLAEADTGYAFVNWTGDVGTVDNVNSADTFITMSDNYSITANFIITYDLETASTLGGSVTQPGEETASYPSGTKVDLLAESSPGYAFVGWTGDVGTIDDVNSADTFITMNGDYSITANFSPMVWTIHLCEGWNAISTPIALDPSMDTWGEFSASLDLDPGALTYYFDGVDQKWKQVMADYQIKPCDAIYVKMASEDTLDIIPSPNPSAPTKQLYVGWNLVGLAYLPFEEGAPPGMKADEALVSVEVVNGGLTGYVIVVSPPMCQPPWVYMGGEIADWDGQHPPPASWMLIGRGYWVFMLNDGTLAGFTFTPL